MTTQIRNELNRNLSSVETFEDVQQTMLAMNKVVESLRSNLDKLQKYVLSDRRLVVKSKNSTDLNAGVANNAVGWDDILAINSDIFEALPDSVHESRIYVLESGWYHIIFSVTGTYGAASAYSGIARLNVNGITNNYSTVGGYLSGASGNDQSTINFETTLRLEEGDWFEILIDREMTAGSTYIQQSGFGLLIVEQKTRDLELEGI